VTRDLRLLPKAHLHVHLESTIRPATRADFGAPPPPPAFAGFGPFVAHNAAVRDRLRTAEQFSWIAAEFCADSAADGVRYAEVTFTAAAHGARLGAPDLPLEAVLDGLRSGAAYGIEVRVLLDHSRRRPYGWAAETVRLALRHDAVVGFGVAGEESTPLAPLAPLIAEAATGGVHLVHHAGETGGPAMIREAIGVGRAERIGHGIRALEDPSLVAELRERQLPLEVCPSSNVALGLVPSLGEHPLPRLVAAGLAVTINTDVPAVTGRTLSEEYEAVRSAFGFSDGELAGSRGRRSGRASLRSRRRSGSTPRFRRGWRNSYVRLPRSPG
jgi:adenosine deaminase